jgi:hypothetical protein
MSEQESARTDDREIEKKGEAKDASPFCRRPALLFCLSFALCACSVPLYKVAPVPRTIPAETGQQVTANGLEVTAAALLEDDKAFARFDANLPLAGIVVVDIKLANRSNQTIKSIKFELRNAAGRKFSPREPKKALEEIMDFEGVSVYPIEGKRQTLEQLRAIALPKKLTLAAEEEVKGVLFFHVKQDVTKLQGLTLIVKNGKTPLMLPLK